MRLDRFISEQTVVSRSDARKIIAQGRVFVNGSAAYESSAKVIPDSDSIFLDGKQIIYKQYIYIMLNKPAGVVCAVRDHLSSTVIEYIPADMRRPGLFPAGRLDKDAEGFVFITDDGELAHMITSPAHHAEKEYVVTLESPAESTYPKLFEDGIDIGNGDVCRPALLSFTNDPCTVHVVLTEGKYHQIKRMFHALGNSVIRLVRIRIGSIVLDPDLPSGQCKEILHKEIENLYAKCR